MLKIRSGCTAICLLLLALSCRAQAPEAPLILKPLLDNAALLEHDGSFDAALGLYHQALGIIPGSRDALLGVARVARAHSSPNDAEAIYKQLLARDQNDADAINGLAWIALGNYQAEQARTGFNSVLSAQPGNAEATAGLAGVDRMRRYQLDLSGGPLRNNSGTSWGTGAELKVSIDANNSLEFGAHRNSRELPTANPLDASNLPSSILRAGYRWQIPGVYGATVAYEEVNRKGLPTGRRLEVLANAKLSGSLQAYGGVRRGAGIGVESLLLHFGLSTPLGGAWEIASTFYAEERRSATPGAKAISVDLIRQGPGDALLVLGASGARNPSLVDIHGRIIYPLGNNHALLLTARRNSFNRESQIEVGWRHYWK